MESPDAPELPWWAPLALVGGATLVATGTSAALIALEATGGSRPWDEARIAFENDLLSQALAQTVGFGAAIAAGWIAFGRELDARRALGILPRPLTTAALAFVAGVALQFPLSELANATRWLVDVPEAERLRVARLIRVHDAPSAARVLVSLVVLAPLVEEVLFRGVVLRGLAARYGDGFALGVSSILFAVVHGAAAAPYALVAGVVLGVVTLSQGSVLPAIALHAGANATPVLLPPSLVAIPGFNTLEPDGAHVPPLLVLGSAAVAAAALAALGRAGRSSA